MIILIILLILLTRKLGYDIIDLQIKLVIVTRRYSYEQGRNFKGKQRREPKQRYL